MKNKSRLAAKSQPTVQERVIREQREIAGGAWGKWTERPDALCHPSRSPYLVRFWVNGTYSVQLHRPPAFSLIELLMIRRHDEQPVHSWSDLQRIKNELIGNDRMAVEVYPREEDLVDSANMYHLWVFPEEMTLKLGLHLNFSTGERNPR